jgi:hypothetical protein
MHTNCFSEKSEKRDHLEDLGENGRMKAGNILPTRGTISISRKALFRIIKYLNKSE